MHHHKGSVCIWVFLYICWFDMEVNRSSDMKDTKAWIDVQLLLFELDISLLVVCEQRPAAKVVCMDCTGTPWNDAPVSAVTPQDKLTQAREIRGWQCHRRMYIVPKLD